jgi:DNA-binding transcriptional MerR regulator
MPPMPRSSEGEGFGQVHGAKRNPSHDGKVKRLESDTFKSIAHHSHFSVSEFDPIGCHLGPKIGAAGAARAFMPPPVGLIRLTFPSMERFRLCLSCPAKHQEHFLMNQTFHRHRHDLRPLRDGRQARHQADGPASRGAIDRSQNEVQVRSPASRARPWPARLPKRAMPSPRRPALSTAGPPQGANRGAAAPGSRPGLPEGALAPTALRPARPSSRSGQRGGLTCWPVNIGQAAALSGVSAKMLRHYESLGLLGHVARTDSGYRQYTEADVHTLRFIKRGRDLGFSMAEIAELVDLWRNRRRASASVKRIAQQPPGRARAAASRPCKRCSARW